MAEKWFKVKQGGPEALQIEETGFHDQICVFIDTHFNEKFDTLNPAYSQHAKLGAQPVERLRLCFARPGNRATQPSHYQQYTLIG